MVLPTFIVVIAVAVEVAMKVSDAVVNKVYKPSLSLANMLKLYLMVYR